MKMLPLFPVIPPSDGAPAMAHPAQAEAQPRGGETPATATPEMLECLLHTAMRRVAEAALTQHVLYTEGAYRPRCGLVREMQNWLRVHELVRTSICPATRTGGVLEPRDLEIALAGWPAEMRDQVVTASRVCGRLSAGEGCPLESEPDEGLIQ